MSTWYINKVKRFLSLRWEQGLTPGESVNLSFVLLSASLFNWVFSVLWSCLKVDPSFSRKRDSHLSLLDIRIPRYQIRQRAGGECVHVLCGLGLYVWSQFYQRDPLDAPGQCCLQGWVWSFKPLLIFIVPLVFLQLKTQGLSRVCGAWNPISTCCSSTDFESWLPL